MKKLLFMMTVLLTLSSCQAQTKKKSDRNTVAKSSEASKKTDAEWKEILTPEQYAVLREKGTERPFTGEYVNTFEKGNYGCAACGQILFASENKYESDCGWPSFDQALKGSVTYHKDTSLGMTRTEVLCSNCQSHLGHVFEDGPKETTGERFCTNSVSIKFIPATK